LIDALLEAAGTGLIRGMKDLGGGGLSTALSEVASSGGTGVDVELDQVRRRESDMPPSEIMVSESQERMLLMLAQDSSEPITKILDKYEVPYSVIGRVTGDGNLTIRWQGKVIADLPAEFVVKAPLIPWPSREPVSRRRARRAVGSRQDIGRSIISLVASPNIASKRWVYQQYDHEVGLRTVMKPGQHDAALLRLPNGHMLAVKGDGNSAQCALDPYNGAAGCVAESCRNVVAVGGEPIAMVDHLQFGDPSDPGVYWSFSRSVQGMADYCTALKIPVVGGKVSFYNEDSSKRAIKPSPISLVVGLVKDEKHVLPMGFASEGDTVVAVGETRAELGGSEYYRMLGSAEAGSSPKVDAASDASLYGAVLKLIRNGWISSVHDCSRGGLAVALAEMCIAGGLGARIDLKKVPSACRRVEDTAFSESHGRFVLASRDAKRVARVLADSGVPHSVIGEVKGRHLVLTSGEKLISELDVVALQRGYEESLPRLMD
ncbi:MAG: AIR synthase-related protein, partial [Thaumarchaeota archaeon]|nr:AIR synthase-related protein [Nitrososphaerota archaeon]